MSPPPTSLGGFPDFTSYFVVPIPLFSSYLGVLSTPMLAPSHIDVVEMESIFVSTRIEKFTRKPNFITLKDFKAFYDTMILEFCMRYGTKFTNIFSFWAVGDILDVWGLECLWIAYPSALTNSPIAQPTYAQTIVVASQAPLANVVIVPYYWCHCRSCSHNNTIDNSWDGNNHNWHLINGVEKILLLF